MCQRPINNRRGVGLVGMEGTKLFVLTFCFEGFVTFLFCKKLTSFIANTLLYVNTFMLFLCCVLHNYNITISVDSHKNAKRS